MGSRVCSARANLGSVYVIPVRGGTGIDTRSSFFGRHPDLAARLAEVDLTAEVVLPRDGGPVVVRVDQSAALAALGQPDAEVVTRWELTAPFRAVTSRRPSAVTQDQCAAPEP